MMKSLDDQKDIKKKNIAKKREISKAKKYLNELKETYSIPLESSGGSVSKETLEELPSLQKLHTTIQNCSRGKPKEE